VYPFHATRLVAASALTVGALAVIVPAAATASRRPSRCRDARASVRRTPTRAIRAAVLCLVNDARRDHGLPPLHARASLDRAAQHWTNTMVGSGYLGHGTDLGGRVIAAGFNWSNVGENIGSGYGTPNQIVNAWLASPDHCRIILDPSFADVGTGIARHAVPGFAHRGGTWTEDYGLPIGARAPSGKWGPADGCPY
jgi:uncharacterized protein YkwD